MFGSLCTFVIWALIWSVKDIRAKGCYMRSPAANSLEKTPLPPAHKFEMQSHIQKLFQSNPCQCTQIKSLLVCNWLRIRAHGVLLNLWRLCIMLKSFEIMQRWNFMHPFSLIASLYYFPAWTMANTLFTIQFHPFILYLVYFLLFWQLLLVPLSLLQLFTLNISSHPSLSFFEPLAVSPLVIFSWPDDACISLVSFWC